MVRKGIYLGLILAQLLSGPLGAQMPDASAADVPGLVSVSASIPHPGALESRVWTASPDVLAFYVRRGFAPAWEEPSRLRQLVGALGELVDDGLAPQDYDLPLLAGALETRVTGETGESRFVEVELRASEALLRALRHLAWGRLDPAEVEAVWMHSALSDPEMRREQLLSWASAALQDVPAAFSSARPASELYDALRARHASLRSDLLRPEGPQIPPGALMRLGTTDPRVPALRERLRHLYPDLDTASADAELFDSGIAAAVRFLQGAHGLQMDGIVGPDTLAALNQSRQERLEQVRVNLERLRWNEAWPRQDGVFVDLVGGTIEVLRNGTPVWNARVQVGRSSRPSPSLVSEITHLTFNPTWTVPPTILREDTLPAVRRDPGFLERNRMRVFDAWGREMSVDEVDWDHPRGIVVRQDSGPFNALGKVAVRFPNPFLVYLHDTPSQGLFEREQRAFSSGCVRVERARELVEVLLWGESEPRRREALRLLAGDNTHDFHLARPVPIVMIYRTVSLSAEGDLVFHPDVYRRDAAVSRALAAVR